MYGVMHKVTGQWLQKKIRTHKVYLHYTSTKHTYTKVSILQHGYGCVYTHLISQFYTVVVGCFTHICANFATRSMTKFIHTYGIYERH